MGYNVTSSGSASIDINTSGAGAPGPISITANNVGTANAPLLIVPNTQGVSVQGNGKQTVFDGTAYARWAKVTLAGQGTFNGQIIAGRVSVSGQSGFQGEQQGQHEDG